MLGYQRTIHEVEAAIVRRIFQLYVGEGAPAPLSPREIAECLNAEGIAPPGARWKNRTARQCASWSYTAIQGHRRLGKGILNNPLYIGQVTWNRSQWVRHPVTKRYTYRVRPKDDWITVEVPELRIVPQPLWESAQAKLSRRRSQPSVPQELWDRVQARLASQRVGGVRKGAPGKYVLSGLLKCGVCGGSYTLKSHSIYYCTTWRSRGPMVCPNGHALSRRRAERSILAAIKDRLYTAENLVALVAEVRMLLQERARQHAGHDTVATHERRGRVLDTEIANLEAAVLTGKATAHLLSMLDARVKEREALAMRTTKTEEPEALAARLASVLERLPTIVAQALEDLEALLGAQQVERGRQVVQALLSEVRLYPITDGGNRRLEADLIGKTLTLVSGQAQKTPLMWLGEEDSNPH